MSARTPELTAGKSVKETGARQQGQVFFLANWKLCGAVTVH